jgi:hypothetical protein
MQSTNEPQILFYLLSGSYFVDWNLAWSTNQGDLSDGFLRACLSTVTNGLAALWSLPVHNAGPWKTDRLGLGRPLGAALQDTLGQNGNQSSRAVFLLGDPTLRAFVTAPPRNLTAAVAVCGTNKHVVLGWTSATESVDRYHVYGSTNPAVSLTNLLAALPSSATSFTNCPAWLNQTNIYLVRSVKLLTSGGGSFTNLSRACSTNILVLP